LRMAFPDITTKPADPVGIPLGIEYNDDPTIPPAYNATCVKSKFFQEASQKEFGRSIRDQPAWLTLQDDPVFKHYPGMAMRRFPEYEHEYPTYDPSDPPPSSSAIKMPPRFRIDRPALKEVPPRLAGQDPRDSHRGYAPRHSSQDRRRSGPDRDRHGGDDRGRERPPRKRSLDASSENGQDNRDMKRARRPQLRRGRSREDHYRGAGVSPRRHSPSPSRFNLKGDPWSPQAGESNFKASGGRRYSDAYQDTKSSPSREQRVSYSDKRHDSGYHSGQSLDKGTSRYRDDERGRRASDRPHRKRKSPSRSRSRRRSPSRDRGRGRSRASTPESDRNRSRSRSRSRSRTRSESPLTRLEAELLGLTGGSNSEPEPKPVAKKRIKRPQVAAAFE
jgi:hypothetical protein